MLNKKIMQKAIHVTLGGLPLLGIFYGALLPLPRIEQQMLMLALLIWIQAFFIFEIFWSGR